jgi:Stage II sporulation protein E (SpoIIE)
VAPFHPLRHETRALAARAGAAFAVFVAIAFVLLAGGSKGQLASAQGGGQGAPPPDAPAVVEEPVLGSETVVDPPAVPEPVTDPVPAEPVPAEPAPEEAPPAEPVPEEPVPEEPLPEEPAGEAPPPEAEPEPEAPEPGARRPGVPLLPEDVVGGGERDISGGNGRWGDDGRWGEDETAPPSGGSKGDWIWDEDGSADPAEPAAPAPSGRPQVTPGAEAGQPGGSSDPGGVLGSDGGGLVGDGTGSLKDRDAGGGGNGEAGATRARYTLASAAQTDAAGGGGGGDTAGATAGGDDGGAGTGTGAADGTGDAGEGSGGGSGGENDGGTAAPEEETEPSVIPEPIREIVEVVPDGLKAALAALAALSVLLGVGYLLAALRARRLARQRRELLQEVGLLQTALLPPVPDKVGALRTSVAYRPADGPGAGGDFYDVLPLAGGRVGFILGDVSGHGRGALARTAFMRYTLRAYLEAGLEPRVALQVAGRVIDDNLGGDFATVLLAVHDPETGSLTYATAGHPAPIVVGREAHDPVTAGSSPPIGVGVRTGLRQTTVPLVPGSVACLFTDGLMDARTHDGILGRERLAELLAQQGDDASAKRLIEQVAAEANTLSDDMAAVIVSPTAGVTAGLFRTEQLELSARELDGPIAGRFLESCGLPQDEVDDAVREAGVLADRFGGVVLHVVFGNRVRVEVIPRNVESIEAASRRVSAGSAR